MSKNSKAIVTLAIGSRFHKTVSRYCEENWRYYADKHGYDVIFIKDPLDTSDLAQSRSPAWQKCLILSQDWSQKYERILWVDSDILLNPMAPDIADGVPFEKTGVVDEYLNPTEDLYFLGLSRMYKYWEKLGYNPTINYTAPEYYASYGIECDYHHIVQTGVMLLSQQHHKETFEYVYYNYEEKGLNYEMRPLSYELLKRDQVHWVDPKFNTMMQFTKAIYYPFLLNNKKNLPMFSRKKVKNLILDTFFANSYFLHFTGAVKEMKDLNWKKFIDKDGFELFL